VGTDFKEGKGCALELTSGSVGVFESNRANPGTTLLMLFGMSWSLSVEYASIKFSSPAALLLCLSFLLSVF